MLIVRGRHRGRRVTPRAFANDWVLTAEFPAEPFRPTVLRVESEEERRFFTDGDHPGTFWSEWRLNDDGSFSSLRPRAARRSYDRAVARARRRGGAR